MSTRPERTSERERIVILGGGMGALAAAWYLTDQPGWQERYQLTIYQQGWRLGGKGASGRNAQRAQRIEEHGLHIWFGFYANAFRMIRAAYDSLGRAPGTPLAGWRDAFKAQDYVALAEPLAGRWQPWHLLFPTRPGSPGEGDPPTMWQMALVLLDWIGDWLDQLDALTGERAGAEIRARDIARSHDMLKALAGSLPADPRTHPEDRHALLARSLEGMRERLHAGYRQLDGAGAVDSDQLRHLRVGLEIGSTVLKGLFADGVFRNGFDSINDVDLRAWLARHGGDPMLCLDSTPVRAAYDMFFAYEDGDFSKPNLEAGTDLRIMMRATLGYKEAFMFKMQAGMGDTVFTPLYQALAARGVAFRFFHRVEELVPDGELVGSIRMTGQVALAGAAYDPLVDVKGLACWPSAPDYAQLDPAHAQLLQERGVDLESYWSDWPAVFEQRFGRPLPTVTLEHGRDFDHVVFAIPVGSLALLCPRLLAGSPALMATATQLRTIATEAYQVWLNRDLAQLGWTFQPGGQEPLLTAFSSPYDTWAPMDHLLAREAWEPGQAPRSVHYFCSAMPMAAYPPQSDSGFPARCAALARQAAVQQLDQDIGALWPAAGASGAFPWQWLVDPNGAAGPARFDSQFWRANVDPSERYVLSVAGSTRYRLGAGESGFGNLTLAGDWLKTGVDAGCIEAAVMGGMQASRAISGYPKTIEGETDI
jgi:uncharacterized protein with NAD-binding domain and iron-sulfur cluster